MRVFLTGCKGQLGKTLHKKLHEHEIYLHDRDSFDITNPIALKNALQQFRPDVLINTAAYTAVEKAEQEPILADAVNHRAVAEIASACKEHNLRLIQISTDFVFDGKRSSPYPSDARCAPLNKYGQTKRDAELAIQNHLPENHLIIRTAWLYSAYGKNFVTTMLRILQEKTELNVVYDQVGSPTSTNTLSEVIMKAINTPDISGIYHWTDAGVASWYDFAVAIYEEAQQTGLVMHNVSINPIRAKDFPCHAKRPSYGVLDKCKTYQDLSIPSTHWRQELRTVIRAIADQEQING